MQYYLLLIAGQLMLGLAHYSHKVFVQKSNSFLPIGALYSALISLFSLPIFFVLSEFDISLDKSLALYSIAYGVLAALSQVMIFVAISRVNLVVYSVFGKSATVLVCLCGFIFFGDKVTLPAVLSVVLITIAIVIPLLQIKSNEGKKSSFVSLMICVIMMINGLLITLVVKSFSELESTTSARSSAFFFYANVVTAIALFIVLYFVTRKKRDGGKSEGSLEGPEKYDIGIMATARKVQWRYYVLIPLTATIANIPCVTNVICMQNMDLAIYTIVLTAAESLVYFLISRLIFKEKSTKLDIIALILCTVAGIVTVF
jgi:drug/metabolite transporter (DMT)-like permease